MRAKYKARVTAVVQARPARVKAQTLPRKRPPAPALALDSEHGSDANAAAVSEVYGATFRQKLTGRLVTIEAIRLTGEWHWHARNADTGAWMRTAGVLNVYSDQFHAVRELSNRMQYLGLERITAWAPRSRSKEATAA